MYLRDPRRLGAVELDPDEERLGPDAFDLTLAQLRVIIAKSRAPVKAVIMDQSRIAGLGNLLCDEILWRAGIDPARPADDARPTPRCVVSTERSATPCGSSVAGADRTPAISPRREDRVSTARRTARRCCAGRSAAGRPTPVPSTRCERQV